MRAVGYVLVGMWTLVVCLINGPMETFSWRWLGTVLACVMIGVGGRLVGRANG